MPCSDVEVSKEILRYLSNVYHQACSIVTDEMFI